MADSTPVETKPEAAALAAAAATAPVATKAGWWILRSHTRLAMLLGGGAVAIAGGTYGYKYIAATPGRVAAQSEPPALAQAKEEPPKPAKSAEPPDLLEIKLPDTPPVPPVRIEHDLDGIKAPTLPPTPSQTESPPLILPPDIKQPKKEDDIFKAPDDLPTTDKRKPDLGPAPLATDVKGKKEHGVREPMPVIRIGAKEVPAIPKTEEVTPPPPPPATTTKDNPLKIDLDLPPLPPTPGAKKDDVKKDDLPIISPPSTIKSPMIPDVPADPMKEKEIKAPEPGLPPVKVPPIADPPTTIKRPMLPDLGPPPPTPPITIDVPPPAAPPAKADKKDMYDEDWHTQRDGDTYVLISTEYLHDPKYAAAIEAYNKDRRKPGERIIRVPPPWVLEEKYQGLINTNDKAASPEIKPAGNLKFEPVAPLTSGSRPAPPPASPSAPTTPTAGNEYRVRNEAGETIREIARKIYGDDNSWRKLWDLNPNLDPTRPIPSGTTLRLAK